MGPVVEEPERPLVFAADFGGEDDAAVGRGVEEVAGGRVFDCETIVAF